MIVFNLSFQGILRRKEDDPIWLLEFIMLTLIETWIGVIILVLNYISIFRKYRWLCSFYHFKNYWEEQKMSHNLNDYRNFEIFTLMILETLSLIVLCYMLNIGHWHTSVTKTLYTTIALVKDVWVSFYNQ